MNELMYGKALTFLCIATSLVGCGPAGLSLYGRLQHEDPSVRLAAVVQAGQSKDPKAAAYLVDRLTDTEAEVRLFASMALEKTTGQTFGYRHYDPPAVRAEAVAAWRAWLEDRGTKDPTLRPEHHAP